MDESERKNFIYNFTDKQVKNLEFESFKKSKESLLSCSKNPKN